VIGRIFIWLFCYVYLQGTDQYCIASVGYAEVMSVRWLLLANVRPHYSCMHT